MIACRCILEIIALLILKILYKDEILTITALLSLHDPVNKATLLINILAEQGYIVYLVNKLQYIVRYTTFKGPMLEFV